MNLPAVCLSSLLCVVACKTNTDQAATAAPSASARVHPTIAPRKQNYEALAAAIASAHPTPAPPAVTVEKIAWNKTCQANRECKSRPRELAECSTPRPKLTWTDVQHQAASMLGQELETVGNIGVTPSGPIKGGACKPGECCHSLRFSMIVDGSPTALPLAGYGCTGDDSKLCCTVENQGQEVVAKGRLAKAPAGSVAKWQLLDATLCIPPRAVEHGRGPAQSGGM